MSAVSAFVLRKTVVVDLDFEPDDVLSSLTDAQLRAESARRGLAPREVEELSGDSVRGARGLLDWSLAKLSAVSGVSMSTIKRLEDGEPGQVRQVKREAIRTALQNAGVRFIAVDGALSIHRGTAVVPARSN